MKRVVLICLAIILFPFCSSAQYRHNNRVFTKQDTLRGSITPERAWWDVSYYHLSVAVNLEDQTIYGSNHIYYKVLSQKDVMQIDLQPPLSISRISQDGEDLDFIREGNAYYIYLNKEQVPGSTKKILIGYGGKPRRAKNAPWDGGVTWDKDEEESPFIATSCQGLGASIWWPNKDHNYDEVDSMLISINIQNPLIAVSNGVLRGVEEQKYNTSTYHWFVSNPINNYCVNMNIGNYAHFSEVYEGEEGPLKCDYYVLNENLDEAKLQFRQAPLMLEAFEYWFGPYPFYEDSYKLVEVPYLGMEHQSSVTYGNKYQNGYLGRDLSGTGHGLKFDFIIIHESGHEWFGNNITYRDIADMWIHESFINYSEALYLEYHFGKEAAEEYEQGIRKNIKNDIPIIGQYGVNNSGSGDMYSKGSNMLHTMRQIISNDTLFRRILRGLNKDFYHSTVTTEEIENYINEKSGINFDLVYDQYLRTVDIPVLEYYFNKNKIYFHWSNVVEAFDMPVKIYWGDKSTWIYPEAQWKSESAQGSRDKMIIDPNFYIFSKLLEKP